MTSAKSKTVISRDPANVISRILDAAEAEFMASGFDAASTNRITESFGGSKATIFRHFQTKENMLEAVVRRIAGRWPEAVPGEDMPVLPPRPWLELFASRTLTWLLGAEPLFLGRLVIAEGHKLPKVARIFELTASLPLRDALAQQFAFWTKAGLFECSDPKHDALHFLDLVIGGPVSRALYGIESPSEKEMRRHIRRSVDLFLGGCATG